MNRRMRRVLERERRRYWDRQGFSRAEYIEGLTRAYYYGIGITLLAARDVLALGSTRLERIWRRIQEMHREIFGDELHHKAIPVSWLWAGEDEGEGAEE